MSKWKLFVVHIHYRYYNRAGCGYALSAAAAVTAIRVLQLVYATAAERSLHLMGSNRLDACKITSTRRHVQLHTWTVDDWHETFTGTFVNYSQYWLLGKYLPYDSNNLFRDFITIAVLLYISLSYVKSNILGNRIKNVIYSMFKLQG